MDTDAHQRFLDYIELFRYFGRGDLKKLTPVEFAELDAELEKLLAIDRKTGLDAAESARAKTLRRLLLRD